MLCLALLLAAAPGMAAPPPPSAGPAPVTVTPRSLSPEPRASGTAIDLPGSGGLEAPAGAQDLAVTIGAVQVDNGFPGMESARQAAFAPVIGRPTTLAALYAAASALEAAYARVGYVLARVAVPPQDLAPGGQFRVTVVDGFVEAVDVTALPRAVRVPVAASLAPILRRRRLRLAEIETALLLAGDVPGLTLHSALARGSEPGGTRLVLDGAFHAATASLGVRNDYAPQLGTYGLSSEWALNSPLGHGESFYGYLAGGRDLDDMLRGDARVQVLGAGGLVRLLRGRLTLNPEATLSQTRPDPLPGTPRTVGLLNRVTLRALYALIRRRDHNAVLSLTAEASDSVNRAPDFALELSRDRYVALRAGLSLDHAGPHPGNLSLTVSQGLGRFGPRPITVPLSRDGAHPGFSRIEVAARVLFGLPGDTALTLSGRAQSSFGAALYRNEQFSLEGEGAVSAYVGGLTAVDEGGWLRGEWGAARAIGRLTLAPYLFGIGGAGRIVRPSAAEPGAMRVGAVGAGLRAQLGPTVTLGAELASAFSDFAPLDGVRRLSVSLGVRL